MVILLLQLFLPGLLVLVAFFAIKIYRIQYPPPIILGCMISKVCPVLYDDILHDIEQLRAEEGSFGRGVRQEARRKSFRLNWLHFCEESEDTMLFLRALRFEDLRINPKKSGMTYDDSEVVAVQLLEEAVQLRWRQVRCGLILILRAKLGLRINKEIFIALLEEYKQLEEQFVDFVGMKNQDYQKMLIDKLGLGNWGVVD